LTYMDILRPGTSEEVGLRDAVTPGVAGSSPVHSANNSTGYSIHSSSPFVFADYIGANHYAAFSGN
jgi:hypothetical protein